jgi:SAM-dependent methyltransferase
VPSSHAAPTPCPICGALGTSALAVGGGRAIARCARCGHGRTVPAPTPAELEEAYRDAYGAGGAKFHDPLERVVRAGSRREAAAVAALLPAAAPRVLDVGCGRGTVLGALVEQGVAAVGVERSATAATGLDPRVELHIAEHLADIGLPAASFGVVLFRHVLEHLTDPIGALQEARRLLHKDGRLVIEVPNFGGRQASWLGESWFHLDVPRHLHHFTEASMTHALRAAGFTVVQVAPGSMLQDVMGWLQSALHLAGRRRMGLYHGLHAGARPPLPDLLAGLALGPAAVGLSLLDRSTGPGAAVAVVARAAHRPNDGEQGEPGC